MATSLTTVLDPLGGLEHGSAGLDVRRQAVNPSLAVSGANELGVKHDATLTDTPAGLHVVSAVGVISSLSAALSFVGDTYKDVSIAMGVPSLLLALSRLYVDVHPGGPFYDIATLTLYDNSDRRDDHIIYLAQVPIVHTTLAAPAIPGDVTLTVVDSSRFVNADLIYVFDPANEFRRIASIAGNVLSLMSPMQNAYLVGASVANAVEVGHVLLWDTTGADQIYVRVAFPAAQTVHLALDLTVRA